MQSQTQICGICQDTINDNTRVDCEKHEFCYECIWEWCKHNNVCPMCKREVTKFTTMVGHAPVPRPVEPYAEKINDYLFYRDFVSLPPFENPNLAGFVVSDDSSFEEVSEFDDVDCRINVSLTAEDYQPISTRTRSRCSR